MVILYIREDNLNFKKTMNLLKKQKLTNSELVAVKGGRKVTKIDHDGDGEWDEKIVTRNDGSTKRVVRVQK